MDNSHCIVQVDKGNASLSWWCSHCLAQILLLVAEWRQEAVLQYARRVMETKRQLSVLVTGANAGGLMVRSRNLRGKPA